jgi:DGQHR domain-containing protein|tara:strand:+ start:2012 stop:3121 length:1110 start_codon:yes stop_codon:yes gene_type:complete
MLPITIPCIPVKQPIGTFYIGSIDHRSLIEITKSDIRRMEGERGFESYLGIQRPLSNKRKQDISDYTNTVDACFPTAIILSIPAVCASYDTANRTMTLKPFSTENGSLLGDVALHEIAKVIDGQHRIAGLEGYKGNSFEVNISIFVDIEVSDEATIFSTVNLAQTKVNKSLTYDLFSLAKKRSPQKLCHQIAVALESSPNSPFYSRIKRLGVAQEHTLPSSITQAAFVNALMKYISDNPIKDRDIYMRGGTPSRGGSGKLIFRNHMIEGRDKELAKLIWNYFDAIKERWPVAWSSTDGGAMLSKTNGFMAFMRLLKDCLEQLKEEEPDKNKFYKILEKVKLSDEDFNTTRYKPGSSGESALYRDLKASI